MALSSMTGFGRGAAAGRGLKVEVELSAVNRRQFDLRATLPRALAALEPELGSLIQSAVARGAVTVTVALSAVGGAGAGARVNLPVARATLAALRRAGRALGLRDDLTLRDLARWPDVLAAGNEPADAQAIWPLVRRALADALAAFLRMRAREGAALARDLVRRLAGLRRAAARIRRRAPAVRAAHGARLRRRLGEAGVTVAARDPALLRELALFADRCDITEELVRLDSHFQQADRLLASTQPAGRALDFLCQELFREINTIGSKANDAAIAREVIAFKAALEIIREQVQNVE